MSVRVYRQVGRRTAVSWKAGPGTGLAAILVGFFWLGVAALIAVGWAVIVTAIVVITLGTATYQYLHRRRASRQTPPE